MTDQKVPGGLKAGKLPHDLLDSLLQRIEHRDPRVLLGAGIGRDAALISFGARTLIAKTDPVTFASGSIGWYAVHVNANDIACMGGEPRWFLATVLLPVGSLPALAESIFEQLRRASAELGVELVGGHTEVTVGLPRPVVVGMMLGEAPADRTISPEQARPGDVLILTKAIAIEGTSLLAREVPERLAAAGVSGAAIDRAAKLLFDPGISVVHDAKLACSGPGGVTAMHDPTEGGLATALAEIAAASGCGLEVETAAVPILPETTEFCEALGADPWGLIASGALLIAATPGAADAVVERVRAGGIPAAVIGRLTASGTGLVLRDGPRTKPLPRFARDEIARLLE